MRQPYTQKELDALPAPTPQKAEELREFAKSLGFAVETNKYGLEYLKLGEWKIAYTSFEQLLHVFNIKP